MRLSTAIKIGIVAVAAIGAAAFLIGPKPDKAPTTSQETIAATEASTVEVLDPVQERPFQVSTWEAGSDDKRTLVVVSHGFAGDRASHGDIAAALAADGYTVAAPTHPDIAGLESNNPQLDPLVLRPRHLSLTIDHMNDSASAPFEEVIVLGHSFGSYSALRLAGAEPSGAGLAQHCAQNPGDVVLCTPKARSRFDGLVAAGDSFADPRVDAIVLMAPAYGPLFSADDLRPIEAEVLIFAAANDDELPGNQVTDFLDALPDRAESVTVDGGHYVFLRPCTADEVTIIPDLCIDADGIDRDATHTAIVSDIVDFLAN